VTHFLTELPFKAAGAGLASAMRVIEFMSTTETCPATGARRRRRRAVWRQLGLRRRVMVVSSVLILLDWQRISTPE
jgi:hypothetical protein